MIRRGVSLVLVAISLVGLTTASHAQTGRQDDKNLMRNLGTGLGALAAHALIGEV